MTKQYTVVFQHTRPHTLWPHAGQLPAYDNVAFTKIYGDDAGKPYNADVFVLTVEGESPDAAIDAARRDAIDDAGTDILAVFEGAPLVLHPSRAVVLRCSCSGCGRAR